MTTSDQNISKPSPTWSVLSPGRTAGGGETEEREDGDGDDLHMSCQSLALDHD